MKGVRSEGKYPVLYLLHGLSDDYTIWQRRTSIERYVADMEIAVVMPDADTSFYSDMVHGRKYWTFLSEELPEIVHDFFPNISEKREDTFVAGLSMGGYGAYKLALGTDRFAAAASLSGAVDLPIELDGIDNELFHIYYFQWNVKPQEEYSRFYFMSADGDLKYQRTTLYNNKGDYFWHSVLV
jgi:S-formylglutathione hydrolase FrmB